MQIQYQDAKRCGVFFMEDKGRRLAEITYQWREASVGSQRHRSACTVLAGSGPSWPVWVFSSRYI